jgi:release factor glutamine methyltransferase
VHRYCFIFLIDINCSAYIPTEEMSGLQVEVREFEDERALHGGLDGLDVVRDIMRHAKDLLAPGGSREVWMEVSSRHPKEIEIWLQDAENARITGLKLLENIKDLSGKDRFVRLKVI